MALSRNCGRGIHGQASLSSQQPTAESEESHRRSLAWQFFLAGTDDVEERVDDCHWQEVSLAGTDDVEERVDD